MNPEDFSEEDFGRQDGRRYSGWTSAITIAATVIILGLVYIFYQLE